MLAYIMTSVIIGLTLSEWQDFITAIIEARRDKNRGGS